MARAIRWTEIALEDLSEAAEFIARDSPFYVPETDDPSIRELFISSYRPIYKVTEDHVAILAFVHGARDLAALWRKRSD